MNAEEQYGWYREGANSCTRGSSRIQSRCSGCSWRHWTATFIAFEDTSFGVHSPLIWCVQHPWRCCWFKPHQHLCCGTDQTLLYLYDAHDSCLSKFCFTAVSPFCMGSLHLLVTFPGKYITITSPVKFYNIFSRRSASLVFWLWVPFIENVEYVDGVSSFHIKITTLMGLDLMVSENQELCTLELRNIGRSLCVIGS